MKFTIAIALMGLFALSSALSVSNEFASGTSASLKEPLNDVIKEINAEKEEDQRVVDRAKGEQAMAEAEALKALKTYNDSKAAMEAAHKAWKKTEADLLTRETEYAANDETRSLEEGHVASIHKTIKALIATGGSETNIGTMPATSVATAKAALEEYIQFSAKPTKAEGLLNLLQRPSTTVSEIKNKFNTVESVIEKERNTDIASVDRQKKVVNDANSEYEKAEADRVAKKDVLDEKDAAVVSAKKLVQTEQDNFDAAQKIRDDDLATIQEAMKLIDELIATEATHKAGPQQTLLQTERQSAALDRLRTKIAAMIKDVDQEEAVQYKVMMTLYQRYKDARTAFILADRNYKKQVMVHRAIEKVWRAHFNKYQEAETSLAQELAIASQERKSLNAVRELLKKLQSAEANVIGACPKDAGGAFCGGFGTCKTNATNPRVKYCACNEGSGRTGRTCEMCKFGWKMATGKNGLKGFCQQVYVPTVKFVQTGIKMVSMAELNDAVQTMVETGRHESQSVNIENVLKAIEKTLDDQEKMMRKQRDDTKLKSDESEKKTHAAKKLMLELKSIRLVKYRAYVMAYRLYKNIRLQYNFEKPLRDKERDLLKKIDAIVVRLQGGEVATKAPTQAPTKFVGTNTHTPTTTPTAKA